MRWYTAIGMKKDDADGRFCVWVDGEEKVLTEMETILWAALTWSFCEEDKVHSQMHRLLVFSLGEKQAQEWADKEDFQFCLNRLVKRGLVVLTEGCTREEAVYSIISRSVIREIQAPELYLRNSEDTYTFTFKFSIVADALLFSVSGKSKAFGNESKTIGEKTERSGIYVKTF